MVSQSVIFQQGGHMTMAGPTNVGAMVKKDNINKWFFLSKIWKIIGHLDN